MRRGSKVHWNWGKSKAEGKIKESFKKPVSKNIQGKKIKRNASDQNPAYLIEQENGNQVLKSASELDEGGKS